MDNTNIQTNKIENFVLPKGLLAYVHNSLQIAWIAEMNATTVAAKMRNERN